MTPDGRSGNARFMLAPQHQKKLNDAVALHNAMRLTEAAQIYSALLGTYPDDPNLLQLLGALETQRGNAPAAIALMERSLARDPGQAAVHANIGNAYHAVGRYDDALQSYDRAIALAPRFAEAYSNRGTILSGLKRHTEALASFDHALSLKQDIADAWLSRGNTLKNLRRYDEAIASYRRVIALDPTRADAVNNIATAFEEMGRLDDAVENYRRAGALAPSYAEAFHNLGGLLQRRRRPEEARDAYRQALKFKPDLPFLRGAYMHTKQHLCDWTAWTAENQQLLADIDAGKPCASPFYLLATTASAAQQRRAATTYAASLYPPTSQPLWRGARKPHDKIRIGYFSADFYNHATALLMSGLIEAHDRARFDIIAFAWGTHESSEMRDRLERAFGGIIDIQHASDHDAAEMARQREIDIAVDLKGHTQNARTGIFAYRPAPIQVSYLGYPGTMGVDYMDYLIADPVLVPPEHRPYYSEQIVYLPESYQANDSKRALPAPRFTRGQLGLPQTGFVFASFNNTFKITPDLFDVWMRLLHDVPGSVLWLLDGNAGAVTALKREAEARGISADRLVFAPRMSGTDHLARHLHVDLCLDTLYCNGHTTTSDALWGGAPVLTCLGATFAGRVSASLLNAMGLPELITEDLADYAAVARELACAPARLGVLKARLVANRATGPLFNTDRLTRHLEAAYTEMWARHQRGAGPGVIQVAPQP